jgi:hypothetical protein
VLGSTERGGGAAGGNSEEVGFCPATKLIRGSAGSQGRAGAVIGVLLAAGPPTASQWIVRHRTTPALFCFKHSGWLRLETPIG